MKNSHKYDLPTAFHVWGHRLNGDEALVRAGKWSRYRYNLISGMGENGKRMTGSVEHIALSRKAAQEGIVLLENNGLLPLKKGTTVALFGIGSLDYMKGGGGSGMVYSSHVSNIYEGFARKEPEYRIYDPLSSYYYHYALPRLKELGKNCIFEEPRVPETIVMDAARHADVAVITIYRFSGEGYDRLAEKGDYYLTDAEVDMVHTVTAAFDHAVVVLNVGGMVDVSWIRENPKIDAAIMAWQAGMEGGAAIADIICGDVNPSGKLTDTFAKSFSDYPSSSSFHDSDSYVTYYEDIYVGYRYFETVPRSSQKVVYPFGYGLSYTTFEISQPVAVQIDRNIQVSVSVLNSGSVPGREVVQVYFSAPQGKLGKSSIELAAFQKTKLLNPGEWQEIVISFPISQMASYDDLGKWKKSAFILEQGAYHFYAGSHCRNLKQANWQYTVAEDFVVTRQLSQQCAPNQIDRRMLSDGSFESLPSTPVRNYDIPEQVNTDKLLDSENIYTLGQVAHGQLSLNAFVSQLTEDELIALVGGIGCRGLSNTAGMGGVDRLGIPPVMTADGPAGIRFDPDCGVSTTAWPCATLLACTWDPELVYQIGKAGGIEAKENAIAIWLAPGMNIHRSPLCGRNFEYFSEDPLITGKMGAAMVQGMQSVGTAASAKHFAANNKETNRLYCDSRLSERALREIYLRGFEICVKEAQPWTVMTAYNSLNGVRCCESYELITNILRKEWGYTGMVTTDWDVHCNQGAAVKAGNDIRMPYGYFDNLKADLARGIITRGHLESCAKHILQMIMKLD